MGKVTQGDTSFSSVRHPDAFSQSFDMDAHETEMWQAVRELRNVAIVPIDFMLDNFIPDSKVDVDATKQYLERDHILSNSGWTDFTPPSPSYLDETEESQFTPLGRIHNHIIAHTTFQGGQSRRPTFNMHVYPSFAPVSQTNARKGPDAAGQLVSGEQQYHSDLNGEDIWFNTAFVEEYCLSNREPDIYANVTGGLRASTATKNNVKNLLWSIGRMFEIDHRRRFAFAVTAEDTQMRIWFCCRQIIFATRPFDFVTEPDTLIRLISSLGYASPTQLGYDPTMELVRSANRWNYRITISGKDIDGKVGTKTYETLGNIISPPTKICSRATRIYEAYDLADSTRTPVVLKDSWVDATRPLEGDTLATIVEGTSAEERSLFLTLLWHGVVSIGGEVDHTHNLIMHGHNIILAHHFEARSKLRKTKVDQDNSIYRADILEVHPEVLSHLCRSTVHAPKVHYRLVFKEKGQSLQELSDSRKVTLSTVMTAARDTIQALSVMWRKQYVHRDISPGNIIMLNGRAKLADFEFSNPYGANRREEKPTGTRDFMAFEILSGRCAIGMCVPAIHSPLHDLESVWWIGVWFLFSHYSPDATLEDPTIREHIDLIDMIGEELFPPFHDTLSRTKVDQVMGGDFSELPWQQFREPLRVFYSKLERMRSELFTLFITTEKTVPVQLSHFAHPDFFDSFRSLFIEGKSFPGDEPLWPMEAIRRKQQRS